MNTSSRKSSSLRSNHPIFEVTKTDNSHNLYCIMGGEESLSRYSPEIVVQDPNNKNGVSSTSSYPVSWNSRLFYPSKLQVLNKVHKSVLEDACVKRVNAEATNGHALLLDVNATQISAVSVGSVAFEEAIAELDNLGEDVYKNTTLFMQLTTEISLFGLQTQVNALFRSGLLFDVLNRALYKPRFDMRNLDLVCFEF